MLSISTAWNYKPDMNVKAALQEIKKVGLDTLELGYRLRHDQLEEMLKLLPEMGMKVESVHNFCPVPNDKESPRHPSNYYRLSSLDEAERKSAVEWTKICVDTAVRTNAKAVVIHAGTVECPDDQSNRLIELYKLGHGETDQFMELRAHVVKERERCKGPYIDAIKKSVSEFIRYAQDKNIKIGLETRYYPVEMPNFQEIGEFLDIFHKDGMFYWHDMGHAEVNARLGLTPHKDFLEAYHSRLMGFHVHGVKVLRDHHAPMHGDFDMEFIFPYMKGKINVIESHHYASFDQMKVAVKMLKEKLGY